MALTRQDIKDYFDEGKKQKATHLLMVSDDFSHEYYPVYVKKGESFADKVAHYNGQSMQRVVETFDLKKKFETQGR